MAMTIASTPISFAQARPRAYARARLVDASGNPVKAGALPAERNFIFHYPYAGTPCFLLNLGRPVKPKAYLTTSNAVRYEWPGGTGPQHSIVAYSAICAHRMSYPTREISFISYRAGATPQSRYSHVIHCCSEHSQYDPADGARVLSGPAPQPLAAILLEHDGRTDDLYAVGTLGGEMFNEFFSSFEFRLAMEFNGRARAEAAGTCIVTELEQYCRQQVKC